MKRWQKILILVYCVASVLALVLTTARATDSERTVSLLKKPIHRALNPAGIRLPLRIH